MKIGRFPVQTPLGVWLGLGTQHCYEAPIALLIKIVEKAVINIGFVRLSLRQHPNSSLKRIFLIDNRPGKTCGSKLILLYSYRGYFRFFLMGVAYSVSVLGAFLCTFYAILPFVNMRNLGLVFSEVFLYFSHVSHNLSIIGV